MPVCHFTFHAYRSRNADHPKGYAQHAQWGIKPSAIALVRYRAKIAHQPPAVFSPEQQTAIIHFARDIGSRRQWNIHGIAADITHVHVLVSWRDAALATVVGAKFKQALAFLIARHAGTLGRRWLSKGSNATPIMDADHSTIYWIFICLNIQRFGGAASNSAPP